MIKIENVSKRFGKKEVLRSITLEVPKHKWLSLVGPSGCGKTTTLNVIAGLIRPDGGTVIIDDVLVDGTSEGRRVRINPSERKVGYVFQDYALFPHMTARGNVSYGLKARHLSEQDVRTRTDKLLQFVGLPDHAEKYPIQLSGGQKQRVALARALATEPHILLLDEPLAALDPRTRESLRVDLKKMLGTLDVTSIFVTHELSEAYAVSDRMAVMGAGRIEQIGHRDEIFTEPSSGYVAHFLGQNVYSGRMISNSSPFSTIEINGITITAGHTVDGSNNTVLVTIKPEDVILSSDSKADHVKWAQPEYNNLRGTVVEIARNRAAIEVTVDVGFLLRLSLTAASILELGLKEGRSLFVHFRADSLAVNPIAE